VPADACWHGAPARPAPSEYDYRTAPTARCGRLRRSWYAVSRLAIFLLIAGPVEAVFGVLLWSRPRMLAGVPELDSVIGAAVIGGGLLVAGLILAGTVPRLLTLLLRPGKTYPLFGFHFTVQHLVSRWSNLAPFNLLFGDSVLITRYLKLIGYRLGRVEQTGSNFGTTFHHEVPALSYIGTGTMVSDGLSMMNADFSSSGFQVKPVVVGPGNFLGNDLAFPPGARTGENCLIATKAMIPLAGPVREGIGLLGSPSFEIPRTVQHDNRFDELSAEPERRRRIIAKTRHNLVTIALHLLVRFALLCWLFAVALLPVSDRGWQGWASTTGPTWRLSSACSRSRIAPSPGSGRCGRGSALSTSCRSGGTSATGRCRRSLSCGSSTAPRSRRRSGGCSVSGWGSGCSTTAARSSSAASPVSPVARRSTWPACSRATPSRTASLPPTGSASDRAAP
jgi:non-ribosomal peptide synthetase-like protein